VRVDAEGFIEDRFVLVSSSLESQVRQGVSLW
jgi:hypothetical protein